MAQYQGTLESIRDLVVKQIRLDPVDDLDKVNAWINLAYQEAVQVTGCLEQTGSAALTSAVASYDLPAAVAQINQITIVYQDSSVSVPLQRVPLDTILNNRRLTLATNQQLWFPQYAMVGQNQIELWPTPGPGQSMVFRYVYLPDELVDDADTPLIMEPYGSKLLEYGALVEGARFLKDVFLLSDYEGAYQTWLAKFQQYLNRRNGASSLSFRIGGHYTDGLLTGLARDVG